LNEDKRGPILEAVVSRMKTIELNLELNSGSKFIGPRGIRFLAVSATIPNVVDVSKWLSCGSKQPSQHFRLVIYTYIEMLLICIKIKITAWVKINVLFG